ncbi:hypothetical protein SS50377_24908 [Spironucleus salmonicida]|uniref:Uncharacterized protein n=1 Tax=Spironucleus salmonicida TaxID=348837 RepID=V6LFW0_9EUKA|nr:hypothetical protein SS50377_24908 [Spironucleus salmonicida]|eukprot:EST43440.1 Hypothetical protein SS50377_16802 [Spironucleus salmonicida]
MSRYSQLSDLQTSYQTLISPIPHTQLIEQFYPSININQLIFKLAALQTTQLVHYSFETNPLPANPLIGQVRRKLEQNVGVGLSNNCLTTLDLDMPLTIVSNFSHEALEVKTLPSFSAHGIPFAVSSGHNLGTLNQFLIYEIKQKHDQLINNHQTKIQTLRQLSQIIINKKSKQSTRNTPVYNLILQTQKSLQDTLTCSSLLTSLVTSNSKAKNILSKLILSFQKTKKSTNLSETLRNIDKKRQKGVLNDIVQILPFSTTTQKLATVLPNNRPYEKYAILAALSALRLKEKAAVLPIQDPQSANFLINQFCQFSNKKTALLISSQQHIKQLPNELSKNVRIFAWNKFHSVKKSQSHEMFSFGWEKLRMNFFGEQKVEQNFDLIDLDLVTVDFDSLISKKIDFSPVLRELNVKQFDFAIINRFDVFLTQKKLRFHNICDIPTDFKLIVSGENGKFKWFNQAFLMQKIDQELLDSFKPEFLTNDDDVLLFQLESAAKSSIEYCLIEQDNVIKEREIEVQEIVFQENQISQNEIICKMREFFDSQEDDDIVTQLETQIGIRTKISQNENQSQMIQVIRNGVLGYDFEKNNCENVAECLKSDITEPCAKDLLIWIQNLENDNKIGVKTQPDSEFGIQQQLRCFELVQKLIQQPEYDEQDDQFLNLSCQLQLNFDCILDFDGLYEFKTEDVPNSIKNIYNGPVSQFGKSLGLVLANSRISSISQLHNSTKQYHIMKQYMKRIIKQNSQSIKFNAKFLEEYIRSEIESINLPNTTNSIIQNLSYFKFDNYFKLNIQKDIFSQTYSFYTPDTEFSIPNSLFRSPLQKPILFPHPTGMAKQILQLLNLKNSRSKYLILTDNDQQIDQLQHQLQKYSHQISISPDLTDLNFSEVVVLPHENSQKAIENLKKIPSKITKIYQVKQPHKLNFKQINPIISCCKLIEDQLPQATFDKINSFQLIKEADKQIVSQIETVDLKERTIADEYFKLCYGGRITPISRKFIRTIFGLQEQQPIIEFTSYSYTNYTLFVNSLINFPLFSTVTTNLKLIGFSQRQVQQQFSTPNTIIIQNKIPHFRSLPTSIFLRFRKNLNFLAQKTIVANDARRDTYQANICVPIFIDQNPFKRFLCPKCCVVNEQLNSCLSIIQACARSALSQSRCTAQGNFLFPDIYFYNSYMQLYHGIYRSFVHQDISSIILTLQINKQNRDYVQHVLTERLLNLIYAQFAEPNSQTFSVNVSQTKDAIHRLALQNSTTSVDFTSLKLPKNIPLKVVWQACRFIKGFQFQNLRGNAILQNLEHHEAKISLGRLSRTQEGIRHPRFEPGTNSVSLLSHMVRRFGGRENQQLVEYAAVCSCIPAWVVSLNVKICDSGFGVRRRCEFPVVLEVLLKNCGGRVILQRIKEHEAVFEVPLTEGWEREVECDVL